MAKKVIKVNSNPNKTPASKNPNPTQAEWGRQDYYENVVAPDEPAKKRTNIKVSSNPATGAPGKTQISLLATKRGPSGLIGGGVGGMFGTKNR